jgi:hypothetical protein
VASGALHWDGLHWDGAPPGANEYLTLRGAAGLSQLTSEAATRGLAGTWTALDVGQGGSW